MWQEKQRQALLEGRTVLERTGEGLMRSEIAALESEAVGHTVIADLAIQRETLERSANRLTEMERNTSRARRILSSMGRATVTNKVILILIIISEIIILTALIYLKFIRKLEH